MTLLKIILYPLVPVYAALVAIRNWLFDKEIFKAKKVGAKVVSVGNITIGGSGKTPMVIYLTNLMKNVDTCFCHSDKDNRLVSNGSKMN